MKNFLCLYILIILFLASCSPASVPTATNTPIPSNTPQPTATLTPTNTPTRTPRPTSTPMRELTAADVGLLHDPKAVSPTYLICHYFTNTMFHAGDGIVFDTHEGNTYYGLAPIEGKIIESVLVNQKVGYEITVETPYLYQGKRVYYDLVHSSGLVSGLSDGSWVNKGDPIVFINKSYGAGGSIKELSLDIAIRNGPKGANSQRSNWQPYSYFSFLQFLYDFTFR